MISYAEKWIVRLKNELRAQKVAAKLAISSILMPDNNPTTNWTANIDLETWAPRLASWRVRFTRSDGRTEPPFVDFAVQASFTPTYEQYMAARGIQVTGNDVNYPEDYNYTSYISATGNGYIDCTIDFKNGAGYFQLATISASFTVQAISLVPGTLTVERIE